MYLKSNQYSTVMAVSLKERMRHNLLSDLRNFLGIPEPDLRSEESEDEVVSYSSNYETDDGSDFQIEEIQNLNDCDKIEFTLQLSEQEWGSIRPVLKTYADDRKYLMMKPQWGDLFNKRIHAEQKLTCPFVFKNKKFYISQDFPFSKVSGKCSETHCKNPIIGICSRDFDENSKSISLTISTLDTRKKVGHKKRRKVGGEKREELKKKLKYTKGACHRNEVGNELLEYSDMEPGYLENSMKCRKIRQEAIDDALKLTGPTAVFDSLLSLKNNGFPEIKIITEDPFCVIYMTAEQFKIWKELARKEGRFKISIDASAGYVRVFKIRDRQTGDTFLYVIVTGCNKKIIPLWQMLSEAHDTNTLKRALQQMVKWGLPTPHEAVSDRSLALMNALPLAFNNCSYRTYLHKSFNLVKDKEGELFPTLILSDRAHIMKATTNWKPLKRDAVVKDFYVRCVAYCIEIEGFEELKQVLETMFMAANSTVHVPGSEFDHKLSYLENKLKTHKNRGGALEDEQIENAEEYASNDIEEDILENSLEYQEVVSEGSIKDFIQNTYDTAISKSRNDEDLELIPNEYYCPSIKTNLFYLFAQCPTWTNILKVWYKSSGVGTSCRSETMFKNERNMSYLTYPVSANRFILHQIQLVNGIVKLLKADLVNKNLLSGLDICLLNSNSEPSNRARAQHIEHPDNENHQELNTQQKSTHEKEILGVRFLKNGNLQEKMLMNGVERHYTNTCAYDSLIQILYMGCENWENLKNYFYGRRDSDFVRCLIKFVENDTYTIDDAHRDRNRLLHPLAQTVTETQVNRVIALPDLIDIFLGNNRSIIRTRNVCRCYQGDDDHTNIFTLNCDTARVILNDVEGGLRRLQESANVFFDASITTCESCGSTKLTKKTIGAPILMIETQDLFLSQNLQVKNLLPQSLTVHGKDYELFELVQCVTHSNPMHYIAFYKKDEKWLKVDDSRSNVVGIDNIPDNIKISVLFYVERVV
ncbi:hypothetical protein QAD02_010519 [Eretmocerus hayati]|uniref:Uncharacterized protein n=1 Tax=Eretmocerus hayati TaxID=131215 RepID=A0ACC2NV32_9HYME|nr:hypothetical protein QAD02_010519 [Eretmocerus hayati]